MLRIAINGYGRIGRAVVRALFERGLHQRLHLEAVNDLGDFATLAHLTRFASAADAMQAARTQMPPCICPENFSENGETYLCYPGDPSHSVPVRALPGPTRLYLRSRRFVPDGGPERLWT